MTRIPDIHIDAPPTAVGHFDIVENRRTSGARSGAHAHLRKMHGLSGALIGWPGIVDVDSGPRPVRAGFRRPALPRIRRNTSHSLPGPCEAFERRGHAPRIPFSAYISRQSPKEG